MTSISAQKGRLLLLRLADAEIAGQYNNVAGIRASDISIAGNPADISSKSTEGWREMLSGAGDVQVTVTCSGLFNSDPQLVAVEAASVSGGDLLDAEILSGSGDTFLSSWSVTNFKRSGPYDAAETFDATLQSSGEVVYYGSPRGSLDFGNVNESGFLQFYGAM
jgi:predicted secreted protein